MTVTLSPSQSAVRTTLQSLLLSVLPAGAEVVEGQDNRVPEPMSPNFVVMTVIAGPRISTNLDEYFDSLFTGSIAGNTLTVSAMQGGAIVVGGAVLGAGVTASTQITALGTGTGGVGTYVVNNSQTVGSETMSASSVAIETDADVTFQLDVHSSDPSTAADMARVISAVLRDEVGVQWFLDNGPAGATPLHADDPRQMPFVNEEQQFETRWVVDAHLQVNYVASGFPQQYAGALAIVTTQVEAAFPPS